MISKEKFVGHIDDIKHIKDFYKGINSFIDKNGGDGAIYFPDATANVISLLHDAFGIADREEWIEHFIFDLDFGSKCQNGVVRIDGKDIPMATSEELYDFLTGNNV